MLLRSQKNGRSGGAGRHEISSKTALRSQARRAMAARLFYNYFARLIGCEVLGVRSHNS